MGEPSVAPRDHAAVRIVSLLPSATEIVYALGLEGSLEGVTFECDHPPEAATLPHVSGTALPTDGSLDAAGIDAAVSAMVAAGESIYTLDDDLVRRIDPDLILAQDLCRVCAVPSGAVEDALDVLGCRAEVVSLDPTTLDEVIACVGTVGRAAGVPEVANRVMRGLRARVDAVRDRVADGPRPRVLALEWADPPFSGGHWVPDMIDAAGGEPVLASAGAPSVRLGWDQVGEADAEVVVFMPCGFDLEGVVDQGPPLLERPELADAGSIVAVDANAHFSRPGPRVVDGVEVLAAVLHPEGDGLPEAAVRLR